MLLGLKLKDEALLCYGVFTLQASSEVGRPETFTPHPPLIARTGMDGATTSPQWFHPSRKLMPDFCVRRSLLPSVYVLSPGLPELGEWQPVNRTTVPTAMSRYFRKLLGFFFIHELNPVHARREMG